jgi:hypothetical protein
MRFAAYDNNDADEDSAEKYVGKRSSEVWKIVMGLGEDWYGGSDNRRLEYRDGMRWEEEAYGNSLIIYFTGYNAP